MNTTIKLGLIGDRLPQYRRAQHAAVEMIKRASDELKIQTEIVWVPTQSLEKRDGLRKLEDFDALWCSPGSPYLNLEGALNGIRFSREQGFPMIGTCAGFQHIVLEYARNVMGIKDAEHAEYNAEAATLLLTQLVCSIANQTLKIYLEPDSRAAKVYGQTEIREYYYCNFGINPDFQQLVDDAGLKITGTDQDGEPRVVELPDHRFFIATLFVPGASYTEGIIEMKEAHPLVKALLEEGIAFRKEREASNVQIFETA